jgi:hypothetical protein
MFSHVLEGHSEFKQPLNFMHTFFYEQRSGPRCGLQTIAINSLESKTAKCQDNVVKSYK